MTLAGAVVGTLADGTQGASQAATSAYAGVTNNYLSHPENEARKKAAIACDGGNQAACQERDEWNALDEKRDNELRAACYANGASDACLTKYAEMLVAYESYKGRIDKNYAENLKAGRGKYSATEERESFKKVLNVPRYDPEGIVLIAGVGIAIASPLVPIALSTLIDSCLMAPAACNSIGIEIATLAAGNALPNGVGVPPVGNIGKAAKAASNIDDAARIGSAAANTERSVNPNKLEHIFGNALHNLDDLVKASEGSQANAFTAVQDAANAALREGRLTVGLNGVLPGGQAGAVLNINGVNVQLVGGRVVNGEVQIGSFSRRFLNE
jgi:hypothetical protein